MKKFYLFISMIIMTSVSHAQWMYSIDFDSPWSENSHIIIDTVSNQNNIWQIGVPNKAIFNSAYSLTHAIITDTVNSYPINDTSSFIIKHIRPGQLGGNESLLLDFWFKFNSDTLTDYGKIEASIDNGNSWINLLTEDVTYFLQWMEPKPVLSGTTNGWQHFSLQLNMLTYMLGYSDTLLYKFTFISDSIQTNKDGWMLDDFQLNDWWEGIENNSSNEMVSIFPNPSKGLLNLPFADLNTNNDIKIINNTGHIIFETSNFKNQLIDLTHLENGIYYLKISNENSTSINKLIICK